MLPAVRLLGNGEIFSDAEDSAESGFSRSAVAIRAAGAIGDIERRLIGTNLLGGIESESASERFPPSQDGLPSASIGDRDDMEDIEPWK